MLPTSEIQEILTQSLSKWGLPTGGIAGDSAVYEIRKLNVALASALKRLDVARTDLATLGFQLVEDAQVMSLPAFRGNASRCVPILKRHFGDEWWKFDGLLDRELSPAPTGG